MVEDGMHKEEVMNLKSGALFRIKKCFAIFLNLLVAAKMICRRVAGY